MGRKIIYGVTTGLVAGVIGLLQDSVISVAMHQLSRDLNTWDTLDNCGSFWASPNSWALSSSWLLAFQNQKSGGMQDSHWRGSAPSSPTFWLKMGR